jgi:hypothetical protein
MIALLDNGQDLEQCEIELRCPVGQLLTPLTRYHLRDPGRPWAIDNGAYSDFRPDNLAQLLEREHHRRHDCLFLTMPDIVGSARRTLEVFHYWTLRPELEGWKIALACQDGQEDLPIPWDQIAAVFIGGSTNWKASEHALHIIKAAKILGKWVHIGRINDPLRFKHFEQHGADSCDGTGTSRYTHTRNAIANRFNQGELLA